MKINEALELAVFYCPKQLNTVRITWEGRPVYDVDVANKYVYPAFHFDKADFFLHGGESRSQKKARQRRDVGTMVGACVTLVIVFMLGSLLF